jgi:glycosyltransferase involved in cell wall biosynthesis
MTEEFIVQSLVGDLISDLVKNGWNVNVFCRRDYSSSYLNHKSNQLNVYNIPFSREINIIKDIQCLIILTCSLFNKKGLFVYSTPKASLIGSISSFILFKKSRIYIMRGRVFENYVSIKLFIFKSIEALIAKLSVDIVFITHYHKNLYIKENLISIKHAHIIHNGSSNGIDLNLFSASVTDRRNFKEELGYCQEDKIVIFAARITLDKGIMDFIRVTINLLKEFSDLKIIIVGRKEMEIDFKKEYLDYYSSVNIIGWTNEIEKYFSISDILLLPSQREGFGNVYVQSSASSCVPVAYNIPGVSLAVKHNFSGLLVDFNDVNGLEQSCKRLLSNDKLRKKLIVSGLKYSLRFDKIAFRKELFKFYEERHDSIYT